MPIFDGQFDGRAGRAAARGFDINLNDTAVEAVWNQTALYLLSDLTQARVEYFSNLSFFHSCYTGNWVFSIRYCAMVPLPINEFAGR